MFEETISKQTKNSLEELSNLEAIKQFYLAGGTAMALQLGHRTSLDLDFFTKKNFSEEKLIGILKNKGKFKLNKKEEQTIHGVFNGTKVSFIYYPYPLVYKKNRFLGVNLADVRDIACMKLDAVATRGSKKDFIDLYVLFKDFYSLEKILIVFKKKYKELDYNIMHILKSLIFFDNAEKEPMPKMHFSLTWKIVKDFFKKEVHK